MVGPAGIRHNTRMDEPALTLAFDRDTVVVTGPDPEQLSALPGCRFDPRAQAHRAEARYYRLIVESLRRQRIPYKDEARAWDVTSGTDGGVVDLSRAAAVAGATAFSRELMTATVVVDPARVMAAG